MQRTKPPFRADHVGSLLRPAALKQARERRAKGEITAAELKAVEDRAIEDIIKKQEEAGLQSITDGEFRRSWWHLDFLWGLDGVEKHVMDTGIAFAAVTTRNEGVKVTGKIGFSNHPMIEHFKFLKAHTTRTPKMTIPAPSALYGRPIGTPIDKAVYPKLDKFFADLGQAYRKAVRAFADAGCRYLQLDEVFIAMLCDPKYRQQMKDRGDDPDRARPAVRRSHQHRDLRHPVRHDGDDASVPRQLQIDLHGHRRLRRRCRKCCSTGSRCTAISWNTTRARAGGFEPLRRLQKGRLAVLGLVTTKTGTLESKDAIKRRIEEAAKFTDLDQLCLSPQCGFASTEEGNTPCRGRTMGEVAHDRRRRARGVGLGSSASAALRSAVADKDCEDRECRTSLPEKSPSSPARGAASGAASRC